MAMTRLRRSGCPPPSPRDPGSSEQEAASDSGSDFEETLIIGKRSRRRAPAGRGRPASQATEQPRKGAWSKADAQRRPERSSLFEAVKLGKSAMEPLVDDWLETYRQDRESGFLELFNFLVRSCGCRSVVTLENLKNLQNSEIIQRLTESFAEDSADYPLSLSTLVWRRFRVGFCELMAVLVHRAQHGVVYDEYLMDNLVALLTGMSDSQVRAFRHTGTLAAMKLMTGLVCVAQSVSLQKDNSQRQYEAERAKGPSRRAPAKLEGLLEQCQEFQEKQEELENLMNAIFKGVFVHRYRDLVPDIRAICIEEMGQWIQCYSASFLADGYLKYIGWTLHDKQKEVRLKCLCTLQGLYRRREMAAQMELFTSRFKTSEKTRVVDVAKYFGNNGFAAAALKKERMLSMVLDREPQVAVEAVRLLTLILQNTEAVLTDADCERVFPLVYASSRPLAAAAGDFLYKKLFVLDAEARHRGSRGFLQLLLAFFIESKFHDHAAYLVDSLWDSAAALLKDWPVLTRLLLEEEEATAEEPFQDYAAVMSPGLLGDDIIANDAWVTKLGGALFGAAQLNGSPGLDDQQESGLVMILVASLRQAAEGQPPVGRCTGKKVFSARERKAQAEDRLRLTQHLIPLLPQLLAKFSADTEKVVLLLETPRYFDLPLYSTGRLEKYLELLLAQLCEVVEKHTDREVLDMASQTLHLLCCPELAFHSRADFARSRLVDHLADKFQHEAAELLQSSFWEKEEAYSVAATLRRIAVLHNAHDLTPWRFFTPCLRLLRHTVDTGEVPTQVVLSAATCAHFSLLWELAHLSNATSSGSQPSQDQVLSLKEKVSSFCSLCQSCLVDMDADIQEQAFVLLSNLLIVFGPELPQGGLEPLQELVYQAEASLQSQLAGFLVDRVFNHAEDTEDEEQQIEELHRRRNLLAGFCKLIVYGVLELSAASDVFKHYAKFYNDYGDIIKETLNRTRQIDRLEWAHTLLLSLQQLLTQLLLEQGPASVDSAAFLEIRDLARRFSLLFGLHQLQNRSALVALHKNGIKFAFQEPASPGTELGLVNLPFLELLSEFSPRLLQPDKALLLSYLKKICQARLASRHREEPYWASFVVYQCSLSLPEDSHPQPHSSAKRRHLEKSSEQDSSSLASGSLLQTPLLTSTALKGMRPLPDIALGQEDSGSESEFVPRLRALEAGEVVMEEPETSEEEEEELSGSLCKKDF